MIPNKSLIICDGYNYFLFIFFSNQWGSLEPGPAGWQIQYEMRVCQTWHVFGAVNHSQPARSSAGTERRVEGAGGQAGGEVGDWSHRSRSWPGGKETCWRWGDCGGCEVEAD